MRLRRACSMTRSSGVEVPGPAGTSPALVIADEQPRPGTTLDALARLRPIRAAIDPDATVTAGNSSGQNDGAAMCVVTTREVAQRHGLRQMLRLRSWAVAGVDPEVMGIGPVPATAVALDRADLRLADIDLIELNEAFAVQVIACLREWVSANTTTTGSTSTVPASHWDIRLAPPVVGSWPPWRTR
jgi:acetyl-CoA C-acetyltransferase